MRKNRSRITTTQLAKICNVSQGTVDRALNNRAGINSKTKEYILSVSKKYGYRPNIFARNLAGGKSGLIGLVVFDIYNEYFSELIMNIENILRKINYYVVVMFSDKNKDRERECINELYQMGVDYIVLCPVNRGIEFSNFLNSLSTPIITVGNRLENVEYVGTDNFLAMKSVTEYVISKGYNNLIYYSPVLKYKDSNIYAQEQRYKGFLAVTKSSHLSYYTALEECDIIKHFTPGLKSAIITSTDYYALKLKISEEFSNVGLIGFDNLSIIDNFKIILDSVDCHNEQIAEKIANFINNPNEFHSSYTDFEIIERGSL